jgi:hypothetical protein
MKFAPNDYWKIKGTWYSSETIGTIDDSIAVLVRDGYQQAAFSKKENANKFIKRWKSVAKVKKVTIRRTSGPTIEEPDMHIPNAYYVIIDI